MMVNNENDKPRRGQLDEMQVQVRDRIGNQSFIMFCYMLLLNIGLEGLGFRWAPYPVSVFLIMIASMGIYLVRIVLSGAYVGPGDKKRTKAAVVGAIISAALAAMIVYGRAFSATRPEDSAGGGAMILFFTSLTITILVLIAAVISRRRALK